MKPFPLQRVGVFSLSSQPDATRYAAGIAALRNCDVSVIEPPILPALRRLAGTDEARAAAFNRLASDASLQALIATRGGYGVTRCLAQIDFAALRTSGAWLIGYSDVSALLLAAASRGCTRLIHGPMICSGWNLFSDAPAEFEREYNALCDIISGDSHSYRFNDATILRAGVVQGRLYPTNLTMLQCLIGTPFLPDLRDAILVLEDVNVPAHGIDRMLSHLRLCGLLAQLSGLVFGTFSEADDAEELPEIFAEYAAMINGPVISGIPFGHTHPSQPLPVGVEATLTADNHGMQLSW
jgi:muramoyltetrapeptide carboxypeptidase